MGINCRKIILSVSALVIVVMLTAIPVFAAPGVCVPATPTAKVSPDNQEVTEGATVQLNGAPSLPNQKVTYSWRHVSGPSVTLSNPTDDKPTFTAPSVGASGASLVFELTVTSCSGQTNSVTTTVAVKDINQAPVASISPATVTVNEGDTVTLDGNASYDPNGDTLSYAWSQTVGTPVTLMPNTSSATVTFTAPNVGMFGESLTFRLTVNDGTLTGTTDRIVNVQWVDEPPVAQVVCPGPVDEGEQVTIYGSGSTDNDDGIASYAWSQLVGPPNVDLSLIYSDIDLKFIAPQLGYHQDGNLPFRLTVTDVGGLYASAECTVTINDVTPPTINGADNSTSEATSASGATVNYTLPTATDLVDGDVAVTCSPESGSTFPLGATTVNCSASDTAGNAATAQFTVTVVDTTPPTLSVPSNITKEATGPTGAATTFTATATDVVDGSVAVSCSPVSGSIFAMGTTTVNCSATDGAGNAASGSFTVTVVDTTPPAISAHGDENVAATSFSSAIVNYTPPPATDLVDGTVPVSCTPAPGATFGIGATTVTCSAADAHGNTASSTFKVNVTYNWTGFFKPVENPGTQNVINVAKAGSAVPVKFSLNGNQGLDIMATGYPSSAGRSCTTDAVEDTIEQTVTAGSSSLTYDVAVDQYIYVWKTDKAWAGTCRQLQVKLKDGSLHVANFKFTK